MKLEGGEKRSLKIERVRCTNNGCGRLHNALPDCLVPYKHYACEVIAGVLDEIITPDDTEDEDYPCEATMLRWKYWLMANYLRIDGYLRSLRRREIRNACCRSMTAVRYILFYNTPEWGEEFTAVTHCEIEEID